MSLTLSLTAATLLLAFIYWLFNFIILYHLTRFGVGVQPKQFALLFLTGSLVLSCYSMWTFTQLDLTTFVQNIGTFSYL